MKENNRMKIAEAYKEGIIVLKIILIIAFSLIITYFFTKAVLEGYEKSDKLEKEMCEKIGMKKKGLEDQNTLICIKVDEYNRIIEEQEMYIKRENK